MDTNLDAITIEILRNKIASLVEEMHYHFYRSGYSTIIRESRDFSCVILDRDGRLIVAPPMFFHAPVYRHLVGRILAVYGSPSLPSSASGGGKGGGVVGHLDPQKPPAPIAHLLFRLFYQVEIRHRQLLQKQKSPLAGRRSRNDTMRLWRLYSC